MDQDQEKEFETFRKVSSIAYGLVMLVGLVGNSLVIFIILRSKHMRTRVNLLLVNLAVADLLSVNICVPTMIFENNYPYVFSSAFWCKMERYLEHVVTSVSSFTILLIGAERFVVIWVPLKAPSILRKRRLHHIITVCLWVSACLISTPYYIRNNIHKEIVWHEDVKANDTLNYTMRCTLKPSPFWNGMIWGLTIVEIYIPLIALIVIYILIFYKLYQSMRQLRLNNANMNGTNMRNALYKRRRVVYLSLCVSIIFFVTVSPSRTWIMCYMYQSCLDKLYSYEHVPIINVAMHFLYMTNFCVNPIAYNVVSKRFRLAFRLFFQTRCCPRTWWENHLTHLFTNRQDQDKWNNGDTRTPRTYQKSSRPQLIAEIQL